jgi:hypothetical protein
LSGIKASQLSGLDPASIANGLLTRLQNGESLGQMFGELKGQLSPVDQGNLLRQLDQSGAALTLAQDFPLPGQFDPKKILGDIF